MNIDGDIEKAASRWEEITGSQRDTDDVNNLEEEYGMSTSHGQERKFQPGSGLILRRGERARGYILFDTYVRQTPSVSEPALRITNFYTGKDVRGIGSFKRILQMFREEAEKRGCKSVVWEPATLMEAHLTNRMGATREGRYYVMPVERLDVDRILNEV